MWCMKITVSVFIRGLKRLRSDKIAKDYMKISYAAGGNLYIPATQLDLIQKYASADAQKAEAESSWHAGLDQNDEEPASKVRYS